jgi:hypothetical protein
MALETKLEATPNLWGETSMATESNRSQTQTSTYTKTKTIFLSDQQNFCIQQTKKGWINQPLTSALLANVQFANDLKISLWIMLSHII